MTGYTWRRRPGPLVRLWDPEWNLIHTDHGPREPWARWAKRIARHLLLLDRYEQRRRRVRRLVGFGYVTEDDHA